MARIRVAIADDDAGIRSALADVLAADPRFAVVGAAATGEELCRLVRSVAADVVLLDVRMPGGGVDAARALRTCSPVSGARPPAVIAVSAHTGGGHRRLDAAGRCRRLPRQGTAGGAAGPGRPVRRR